MVLSAYLQLMSLITSFNFSIFPSLKIGSFIQETSVKTIMDIIYIKASFGDALIANIINNSLTVKAVFVSWYSVLLKIYYI